VKSEKAKTAMLWEEGSAKKMVLGNIIGAAIITLCYV